MDDKDVEDAHFLYKALKSYIKEEELETWLRTFGVSMKSGEETEGQT